MMMIMMNLIMMMMISKFMGIIDLVVQEEETKIITIMFEEGDL